MNTEIITVDCQYVREKLTAAFIIKNGDECVIIETGHPGAVKHIVNALRENNIAPEAVSHIFVTHVHLDHCGGLAGLLDICKNALVICHTRARLHLIDPERLVKGSIAVYGEPLFKSIYGQIFPVAGDKIITPEDNEILNFGRLSFQIYYMAGHARHHICIRELATNTLFSGDTFGLAYPDFQTGSRRFIYPATTPSDFDLLEARKSIQRIVDINPASIWLTHFGNWENIQEGADQLNHALAEIESFQTEAEQTGLEGESLQKFCHAQLKKFVTHELEIRGVRLSTEQWKIFDYDVKLNASGISYAIDKKRRELDRG